jgi:hypothetical protein
MNGCVHILFGSFVPVILHKQLNCAYKLGSESFVYGAMYGEARFTSSADWSTNCGFSAPFRYIVQLLQLPGARGEGRGARGYSVSTGADGTLGATVIHVSAVKVSEVSVYGRVRLP